MRAGDAMFCKQATALCARSIRHAIVIDRRASRAQGTTGASTPTATTAATRCARRSSAASTPRAGGTSRPRTRAAPRPTATCGGTGPQRWAAPPTPPSLPSFERQLEQIINESLKCHVYQPCMYVETSSTRSDAANTPKASSPSSSAAPALGVGTKPTVRPGGSSRKALSSNRPAQTVVRR